MQDTIIKAVEFLKENDPVLSEIISKVGPCTLKPSESFFKNLIKSVISQQLSLSAARTIWSRVEGLTDQTIDPSFILDIDQESLRKAGLSNQKVKYVKEIARFFIEDPLISEKLKIMTNEEIIQMLTKIKGVGIWTAQMFLIFSLCRTDVLPVDDLGLKKSLKIHYLNQIESEPLHLVDIAQKWGGFSTIACWYLWKALDV
ncbi:MAG: hypothetical protein M0Q38_00120 [Bacteroidales bacterium]|jgi:DNA-3-methyladenine glycosylase II|nr:hypothetical protein [Bacteroidales bacterium]